MSSILICSTPAVGHVAPLSAIARYLVDHGHTVRYLTGERFRATVEATGAEFLPLTGKADINLDDPTSDYPERAKQSGAAAIRFDVRHLFLEPVPDQLAAVDRALAALPTDLIMVEPTFASAAAMIARVSVPRPPIIALGIVPLGTPDPDVAPFGLGIPPLSGPVGRVRNALLTVIANKVIFGSVMKRADEIFTETVGVGVTGGLLDWHTHADEIVQFSVPGFEYPRRNTASNLHFVGPVTRAVASTTPLPAWWSDLDGSRPIVHVTQGTLANRDFSALIQPTITALADMDLLVVVSTGGRPVTELGPLPLNVRAAEMLPYDKLFPLISLFVSNGGYGGVQYSLEHGVPLVVAGTTEDKVEVNARVAWSGVGINLKTDTPKPATIRAAAKRVLASPVYRAAAAAIGTEIAASPGLPELERVVNASIRSRVRV